MYALVAMRHTSEKSVEAGIKYFILGALASGFLLYGMSMLYGVTGSLDLIEIFKTVADPRVNQGRNTLRRTVIATVAVTWEKVAIQIQTRSIRRRQTKFMPARLADQQRPMPSNRILLR